MQARCEGDKSFATLKLHFGIRLRILDPSPFPAQEIQMEKPASGRETQHNHLGIVMGKTPRNLVLLANAVKNYRSVSLLVCKLGLLVICSCGREQA